MKAWMKLLAAFVKIAKSGYYFYQACLSFRLQQLDS
jgi:hypothetical protein